MQITALDAPFGAEVIGLDLNKPIFEKTVKKLKKRGSKKRDRKAAQHRLDGISQMMSSAKQCAKCCAKFSITESMDWKVFVTPAREVQLTCIDCLEANATDASG